MGIEMRSGLIVEDLVEVRNWLRETLAHCYPGMMIHCVATLSEARDWLSGAPAPDLALIDLGLPDGSGIELIEWLVRHAPQTRRVVASIHDDDTHLFAALRAGAEGYILKDQSIDHAARLLEGISAGHPPLSPSIARRILGSFKPENTNPRPSLTARETEVLRLISKGLTIAECALALELSRHTVGGYVKEIYRKLNVSSRAEAAVSARQIGLV